MEKLKFRQLHLDFHTGESFPNVAEDFTKEEFAQILKMGNINSVNLFAKCHHGCFYYYGSKYFVHPNLKRNLLKEQSEVCDELGIDYHLYVSAGFDEYYAKLRPDWRYRYFEAVAPIKDEPRFHLLCLNNDEYLKILCEQIEEVVLNFPTAKGVFLDITDERDCFCAKCREDYKKLDPIYASDQSKRPSDEFVNLHMENCYRKYYTKVNETIKKLRPDFEIFHNMGNVPRSRRDLLDASTHYEIEALPNGWWGFDYFPVTCSYIRQLGVDFTAHTARFHTTWGDFGGYKHQNAFLYETAWHNSFGSKTIMGDQLHPSGKFDLDTYQKLGNAYRRIEILEKYSENINSISDIAIFSQDYVKRIFQQNGDIGASKILSQCNYMYDVIDYHSDFSKYKIIILPDNIELDEKLKEKIKIFISFGGKILASGTSGVYNGNIAFDLGAHFLGEELSIPAFAKSLMPLKSYKDIKATIYEKSQIIKPTGKVLVENYLPYANREYESFSSHLYNPYSNKKVSAGVTVGNDGAYISWDIFSEYTKYGSLWSKEIVDLTLKELFNGKKQITTNLPSEAIINVFDQPKENRYIIHLLYAQSIMRGSNIVIEDIIPLHNINICLNGLKKAKKCFDAITGEDVSFVFNEKEMTIFVDCIMCHKTIVMEY